MIHGICKAVLAAVFATVAPVDDKAPTPVVLGGLKSTPPAGWKKSETKKPFREAEFTIAKKEGEPENTEVTVFGFPPGQGGTLEANIARWKKQFKAPADAQAKSETLKIAGNEVNVLDMEGVYLFKARPMDTTAVEKPHFRAVQVFFPVGDRLFTIRLVGPEKTVAAQRAAFMDWVKNFK